MTPANCVVRARRCAVTPRDRSAWCLAFFLLLALVGCTTPAQKRDAVPSEDLATTTARAEQSYENADWHTAAEAYGVLVAAKSADVDLWFRYANSLARSDQSERAVLAYREVLARDKNYAKAWFNMGIVQLRDAAASFSRMNTNVDNSDPLLQDDPRSKPDPVAPVAEISESQPTAPLNPGRVVTLGSAGSGRSLPRRPSRLSSGPRQSRQPRKRKLARAGWHSTQINLDQNR